MKKDLFSIIATAAIISGCAVIIASAAHGNIKRTGSFESAAKTETAAQQPDQTKETAPGQPVRQAATGQTAPLVPHTPATARTAVEASSTVPAPAIHAAQIRRADDDNDKTEPEYRETRELEDE